MLIKLFGIELSLQTALCVVGIIFLVQTVLPAFLVSDLIIRGSVPLGIISSITGNSSVIYMAPGYVLYFANLVIPALAGAFIIIASRYKVK
ncbi:MAG: hypothetical protein H7321_09235 [Bacteroidia bacterium]|nr:hypothetical protein [Bacteroidia bacterium]